MRLQVDQLPYGYYALHKALLVFLSMVPTQTTLEYAANKTPLACLLYLTTSYLYAPPINPYSPTWLRLGNAMLPLPERGRVPGRVAGRILCFATLTPFLCY